MSEFRRRLMMAGGSGSIGYYTIDQTGTYSDPAQMVRDRDVSGIQAIRSASHLYVGELVNGVLQCKQVSDTDKTKYADGTSVVLDGEKDMFMKLPQFWWKIEEVGNNSDIVKFSFCMSPKTGWNEWEGNTFIGVYKSSVSSNKVYSRSGLTTTGNIYWGNYKTYARNRGAGYSLETYDFVRIFSLLFWGYYGTLNGKDVIGDGNSSAFPTTGGCDSLGMTDTNALNNGGNSINCWGIEDWWACCGEWVDDLKTKRPYVYFLDYNGNTIRTFTRTTTQSTNTITKMYWGNDADMLPKAWASSLNENYYATWGVYMNNINEYYADRGGEGGTDRRNVCGFSFNLRNNITSSNTIAARLQYKGNYQIIR